jgi:hypothetical protein
MIALVRASFVHSALLALGCWSLWAQAVYRAPQSFLTVALAALTIAVTGLSLAVWLAGAVQMMGAGRPRRLVRIGRVTCAVLVGALALWGLFLFGNGWLDRSDPVARPTHILGIAGGETATGVTVPMTWMTLRSWGDPTREERVLVQWQERPRLWGGQPVVVLLRPGFFGVPWISAIEPDFETQSREVFKLVPEASGVWKELALFNVRINRLDEARRVAGEYFARFPQSPEFPVQIARILAGRDRFADVTALLAPVAVRHEDVDVYMLLGYALGMQGRRDEGLRYLERARTMQPDHWWPHYALGWVHGTHGDTASAVLSFERALQLRPGLRDAEAQLARLRPHVAGRPRE